MNDELKRLRIGIVLIFNNVIAEFFKGSEGFLVSRPGFEPQVLKY